MLNLTVNLLLSAAIGVKLRHVVQEPPILWVRHVKNQAQCDKFNVASTPLYFFDKATCSCLWDKSLKPDSQITDQSEDYY